MGDGHCCEGMTMKAWILVTYEHGRFVGNQMCTVFNTRTNQVGIFRRLKSTMEDSTLIVDVEGYGIREWSETEVIECRKTIEGLSINDRVKLE